jgi:predicted RNA-binding protein with EMAP domain
VSYLAIQYGNISNDYNLLEFILNTLNHVKSGEAKCIVLAIKIWEGVIKRILDHNDVDQ